MGADKPLIKKQITKIQKPFPLTLFGIAVLLFVVALFRILYFQEETEGPMFSPKEDERLQRRLKEIDDAEQYALVAISDGWYPCLQSGRSTYYLLAGEVWKYGTTTKGQFGRYGIKYLAKMNVSYFIQFHGTISECLKEEQRKLFYYPYLPENLARSEKDRLPRPPFNSKMQ